MLIYWLNLVFMVFKRARSPNLSKPNELNIQRKKQIFLALKLFLFCGFIVSSPDTYFIFVVFEIHRSDWVRCIWPIYLSFFFWSDGFWLLSFKWCRLFWFIRVCFFFNKNISLIGAHRKKGVDCIRHELM